MRLRTELTFLFAVVLLLGMTSDGWSQERKKQSKKPQVIEGTVYEVGQRTIQVDTGQRRRGRIAPIILPVDPTVTKFKKAAPQEVKLEDLKKGDVVIIKYNENGKYDPILYVIATGEKKEIKEKRRGKKKK